eukprot:5351793-Prorocentrum_lima.AAC.1
MTSSLVGSEMCIRDSKSTTLHPHQKKKGGGGDQLHMWPGGVSKHSGRAVSYTHLTLPTICSV